MTDKRLSEHSERIICELPMKLPSLNDYVRACRANRFEGAKMKKRLEKEIGLFVRRLPVISDPVRITFIWQEKNKRRDYDNIAFAKKFILDALVKEGRLKDDNRKCVAGFVDCFSYGDEWKVTLVIERKDDESERADP